MRARAIAGLAIGALFGLAVGLLIGSLLARHNYLPTLAASYWRLVLFCAIIYVPVFALAGAAARFVRLTALGAAAGLALFLFGGFVINARFPGGPTAPPALWVNLGLCAASVGLAYLLGGISRRFRWRATWAAGAGLLGAVALAAAVLGWTPTPPEKEWDERVSLPVPGSRRVALIGLDGATWRIAEPLMQAGRMPVLAGLRERGVHATLQTFAPSASPLIWTTMVTGKEYLRHGITKFEGWRVPFFRCGALEIPTWSGVDKVVRRFAVRPIGSGDRRTNALWNILSEAGWTVGFSSWWASYPAEPVIGFNISDRYTFVLKSQRRSGFDYLTEPPGLIYPDSLQAALVSSFVLPSELTEDALAPFFRLEPGDLDTIRGLEGWEKPRAGDAGFETPNEFFLGAFALPYLDDLSRTRMILSAYREYRPHLLGFYIRGIDDIQHHFWHFMEPEKFPRETIPPEQLAKFGGLIERYYAFTDSLVGVVIDALEPGTTVIVVSDHGQVASGLIPWSGTHFRKRPPPGMLIAAGPAIAAGASLDSASVFDIAPTILRALGFPTARDQHGRPLDEILTPEIKASAPPSIRSYDDYFHSWKLAGTLATESGVIDTEMRERLKALGYVQ